MNKIDTDSYQLDLSPPNYRPAIELALNFSAGGVEIHDFLYLEDVDRWYVDLTERGMHFDAYPLDGSFVRTCFAAIKKGITSWI
jgi:hypothetical protein